MYDEIAATYDAAFDGATGRDALYVEGSTQTPCRVLRYAPDASRQPTSGFAIGELMVAEARRYLLVRSKEIAAPQANAYIQILTPPSTWRIGEDHPIAHDDDGYVWRCAVVRET